MIYAIFTIFKTFGVKSAYINDYERYTVKQILFKSPKLLEERYYA